MNRSGPGLKSLEAGQVGRPEKGKSLSTILGSCDSPDIAFQLSRRSVLRASSVFAASIPVLVFHVDDGISQRSVLSRWEPVLSLKLQNELQKLSKRLLRQSTGVVRRISSIFSSLSRRSELCQNCSLLVDTSGCSSRKKLCT